MRMYASSRFKDRTLDNVKFSGQICVSDPVRCWSKEWIDCTYDIAEEKSKFGKYELSISEFNKVSKDDMKQEFTLLEKIYNDKHIDQLKSTNLHKQIDKQRNRYSNVSEINSATRVRLLEDAGMREVYCESEENYDSTLESFRVL